MAVVWVGVAAWFTVHALRLAAAELDRALVAPVNLLLSVLAAVGWGLLGGLEAWEVAAAVGVAAILNKLLSLLTLVTDRLLLRNREQR